MIFKPKSSSIIHGLPPARRALVDRWLFEENHSYIEIARRCRRRWKFKVQTSTLCDYYRRTFQERALERIATSAQSARAFQRKFKQNPADYYRLLDNMLGQLAFEMTLASGRKEFDSRVVMQFTKLLLDGRKFSLARQKWEFDAARACLNHLPQLTKIADNDSLDEDARVERARIRLFGSAPK